MHSTRQAKILYLDRSINYRISFQNVSQMLGRKACVAEPQNILPVLRHCLGNVVNSLVFGVVYEENDPTWKWLQDLQELGTKHIGVAGPVNFMPFLRSVYLLMFASVLHEDEDRLAFLWLNSSV
jgi:hypothetical protein